MEIKCVFIVLNLSKKKQTYGYNGSLLVFSLQETNKPGISV